ncbi:glycosyl transferase group 1 [Scytonema hofmannii PCC 7110]|uniref:Glycosyl transferase group 1 n=1 Tax=Scytonema hofmannii PCC 7110 TaxID=128403 RepID=A0A139XA47_9CYAN|nr:glycosyltransferase family 1 protein [Scytonema hofmannii]KYC41561.1 glycosyl transferase group 1 [Scytonema hofmannii PCC 7110]
MIKIVYDYQVFCWQQYGGISRYICELVNHLAEDKNFDVKILAMAYVNQYLKALHKNKANTVVGYQIPKIPKTGNLIRSFNSNLSKIYLTANRPHIIHQTFYYPQRIVSRKVKVVATVHDMLHEKFPHFFPGYRTSTEKIEAIKRADRIICVSENTKKDLMEILDVNSEKISVVYHGVAVPFKTKHDNIHQLEPYILYVGAREGYKNFQGLLQAYATSDQIKNNFNLVCFGGGSFSSDELRRMAALGLTEEQVLYFSGDDTALTALYRYASVFVYPSLYEGFGIPPLEAMALACPVACSNKSSLPEVVGNAAEFFDPEEAESITEALEKILFSEQRALDLVTLGKERVKLFTWEKCAKQTGLVYSSLL